MRRWRAAAVDVVAVLVFVLIGRRSHDEGSAAAGVLGTAWPFLLGLAAGWVVVAGRRLDPYGRVAGATLVVATVLVGMLARRLLAGDGTAVSFVIVATIVLTTFLLGWRLVLSKAVARPA